MKTVKFTLSIFVMLVFLGLNDASGQYWSLSGTNIRNTNSGYVAIGTTSTPQSLLYVAKNLTEPTATIRNLGGTGGASFRMWDNLSGADWKFKATTTGGFKIRDNAWGLDVMTFEANSAANAIYVNSLGYVGLGITTPLEKLHVNGYFQLKNTTSYSFMFIDHTYGTSGQSGLAFTNNGSYRAYIYYDEDDDLLRLSANNSPTADYALVVKNNSRIGINTANPAAKLDVYTDANTYARLGNSAVTPHYFYHYEIASEGNAQSALYAYRTRDAANNGSSYSVTGSNQALRAYNYWGDLYTFGIAGFNWNDYTRCGGTLGADESGVFWGALGYRNNAGSTYGGYFTSYTTGTGKSNEPANVGIGLGAWGDLLGADIHGKVYGIYAEGDNYAMFSHGTVYKDDLDVHLQENGTNTKTALYTNVSTDVTVQTSGQAVLSNGKASIAFDPAFATSVSPDLPVVVTVTPTGKSYGVYLSDVTSAGFTVVENNDGKSNVTVNYIAIGKRAGYENPSLSSEVIDAAYTDNISRGLRPDAELQSNGEGLYYENGQLVVGIHPSTLPDPNKPKEEVPIPVTTATQGGQNQQPDDRAPIGD